MVTRILWSTDSEQLDQRAQHMGVGWFAAEFQDRALERVLGRLRGKGSWPPLYTTGLRMQGAAARSANSADSASTSRSVSQPALRSASAGGHRQPADARSQ